jgi:hypothetical protein
VKRIPDSYWEAGISYPEYKKLIHLLASGSVVPEILYPPHLQKYVPINLRRMDRWEKRSHAIQRSDDRTLANGSAFRILVLTEAWCGDAAHVLPVAEKVIRSWDGLDVRYLFRDQHPELMQAFLTSGSRSIPKYILFRKEDGQVIETWGPRPSVLQAWTMNERSKVNFDPDAISVYQQSWYNSDKGNLIIEELDGWLEKSLSAENFL